MRSWRMMGARRRWSISGAVLLVLVGSLLAVMEARAGTSQPLTLKGIELVSNPAAAATPMIAVTPTSGVPGSGLTVNGINWTPNHSIFVQIGSSSFNTNVVCVLTASSDGQITGNQPNGGCVVPNVPAGSRSLVAIDQQNQASTATGTNFTVTPVLVLTPANSSSGAPASPGVTVTVQGHGFAANSTVSGFKFDGSAVTTSPTSIGTDGNGNFNSSVTFTVPSATAASHTVSAQDTPTNTGSASLRVYVPHTTVSPVSGAPGRGLTVSGSGWPAGDTVFVQIGSSTFNTDDVCVLTASSDGTIAGTQPGNSCQVPNVPKGTQPLVSIDQQHQGVVATGTFAVTPVLVLTPANSSAGAPASPGVTMTVQGHGFAANSSVSGFKFDGVALASIPSSIGTDSNGNFSGSVSFSVPSTTAGNHTVSAQDIPANTGSATLRVYTPHTTLAPTSGSPGRGLTVSGSGWPAGDTVFVQIGSSTFNTDDVCVLTASSDGTIGGTQAGNSCQVPNVPAGSEPQVSIDQQHQGVVQTGTFTVNPVLVLTPANSSAGHPAGPGVTVTVQGHGFAANSSVSGFKFDGVALSTIPSSISTDSNGNFTGSVSFTVPSATAASHTVSTQDLAAHSGSASLRVYVPHVTVSPTSGAANRGLKVTGSGWPAGDTIFVQIGSGTFNTDVACVLTVTATGTITGNQTNGNCHVPSIGPGSQPLVAIDQQNQGVIANGAAFTVS